MRHLPVAVRLLLLLALQLGQAAALWAERFEPATIRRSWTQPEGLPTNEVTALSLSNSGFLYVGTANGVLRFDGQRFIPVAQTSQESPTERGIATFACIPGSDDILVAPKTGGLLRLSGETLLEQSLPPELARLPIESLFFENSITLWLGFKGGTALRKQAGRSEVFPPAETAPDAAPIEFARDGKGSVWVLRKGSLTRYADGRLIALPDMGIEKNAPIHIASSRQEGPWVIIGEEVHKILDGKRHSVARLSNPISAYYIRVLHEHTSGDLWIGTRSSGLHRLRPSGEVEQESPFPDDISAIIEDKSGNLWIGSANGGLTRLKTGVLRILDRNAGLFENRSLSLCRDNQDTLWLANRDGGIAFLTEAGSFDQFETTREWTGFSAFSVTPAKEGGVWASTSHGLLHINANGLLERLDLGPIAGRQPPGIMLSAANGDLWLSLAAQGLCRIRDHQSSHYGPEHGLPNHPILALAEDSEGVIWAGSEDSKIFQSTSGNTFTERHLIPSVNKGAIQSFHFDRFGNTWIGTEKAGLFLVAEQRQFHFGPSSGLPFNNITQIISDENDVLWLGSPSGIFHISIEELKRLSEGSLERIYPVFIGPDEGLREATCSGGHHPSIWRSKGGIIWFATRQGVIAIDPAKEGLSPERPRAKILGLRLNGTPMPAAASYSIPAGRHSIEIAYTAPNLSTPNRLRIRYRLIGYDETWREGTVEGVARYHRLPPATYRFELTALLAGAPGAEYGDSLAVVVRAAWWQTLWFWSLSGAALLVSLVFVVRQVSHRRLRAKLALLERKSELERERTRIAHNIHDDLGAGLTRISLLTQSGHDKAKLQLDRIYAIVSELIQSMDEIVWAVNPTNDNLENLANYLGEYAQSFLSDTGLRCRVHIPPTLPNNILTTQFRHHLFLTCKEALNNVVKHAKATDVVLELSASDTALCIEIRDNGIGLPDTLSPSTKRNGMNSMRTRIRELGGDLSFSSGTEAGTSVCVRIPMKASNKIS